MKLIINGSEVDFTLENEKSVGDVLKSIETECEKIDATIIDIKVNDNQIAADEIESLSNMKIEDCKCLEIVSIALNDIILSFKDLCPRMEALCGKLSEMPVLLQQSKEQESSEIIKEFADIFDILCHLITLSTLFQESFKNKLIEGETLSEFLQNFSPLLTDFENSLKSKDSILTGDLAEYEIKPRLENFINAVRSF